MNRKIKYRAWDKLNENMHEVSRLSFSRDDSERITVDSKIFENDTRFLTSKNSVLMQYTGLKDKNGVEIYEGHILFDEHNEEFGQIVFGEGKFLYETSTVSTDLFEVADIFEVRGNIYENPESLEELK